MTFGGMVVSRALLFGAVSSAVLHSARVDAQTSTALPSVTIDAPVARANPPRRPIARPITSRPRATARRQQSAQPAPVVRAVAAPGPAVRAPAAQAAQEIGSGPVNGLVATQTATGTKTNTPIVEIPQSISVVPKDQITAQGAQSVGQALRYTPGVLPEPGGVADFSSNPIRVRGFRTELYIDGTRMPTPPSAAAYPEVEPYNVERIEVLKGPSSALYGSSGPGGLINATSKRPSETGPIREIGLQTGSWNRKQVQFDISDRIAGNDNALFRIVGLWRDADHQINYFQDKREFIAPSLTFKNERTKLTLLASYFHSDQRFSFFNYLPASGTILPNPNGRISQRFYNGEPSYDRLARSQYTAGYAFEHRFNDILQFRQNLRYVVSQNDIYTIAMGRQGSDPLINNDPRTGLLIGDASLRNTRRGAIYTGSMNRSLTIDNQLEAKFTTGPLAHNVVLGLDYRNLDSTYQYIAGGTRTTIDIFNPVYGNVITPGSVIFNDDVYKLRQTGVYLQDQIKFGGWILTLSGRHDWATSQVDATPHNKGFVGPSDTAFTGRAGLSYQFSNGVVPYISYGSSFDPVVGTAFGGATLFRPTTGVQVEGGVKYQPPGTRTLITAAAFDIQQKNVLTRDVLNPGFSVQTGQVNVKGFEFEARTEILPKLSLIAAYTFLDARIAKSNVPGEVGQRPMATAKHQVALWAQYGVTGPYLNGLTVGAGVRYIGETLAFQPAVNYGGTIGLVPAFTLRTPGYTLFDAMVSYDLNELSPSLAGASLRINATNLFNQYYISSCYSVIQCAMGSGRAVLATLTYKW